MELEIHDERGEVKGKVDFDESILGEKLRPKLLHQVAVGYMANRRRGTASAKTRAEVSGSGRKLWRQKGTGRARVGDRRAPIRVGGGVAHPPKPRSFRQKLTKTMRRQALLSALLSKFRDDEVIVIDTPELEAPKTKRIAQMLEALGLGTSGKGSCLIVTREADRNLWKSSRNIPGVRALPMGNLNALEVLRHKRLLITREVLADLPQILRRREVAR